MNLTYPIREYENVQKFKNYFLEKKEYRNYMLVVICLNTALRISDVISLKWSDVLDDGGNVRSHIVLREKKTGKETKILVNSNIKGAGKLYLKNNRPMTYLFENKSGEHISRVQAYSIIKNGGAASGIGESISCHTLRKTFGYHAWKNGIPPALLMEIYNHSSYNITKRYLGIVQDDKDTVFGNILL